MIAAAAGTMQCACTSIVLMRLPLTTTSRRRGCDAGGGAALVTPQPTNASPANAPASNPPVSGIFVLPNAVSFSSRPNYARPPSGER